MTVPAPIPHYQRDRTTWAAFGALFAFGFVNAVLGPALPYIRATEHISYLVGALHQAAYAAGGGLAGLLAARNWLSLGRTMVVSAGLIGAALVGLAVGYGGVPAITITAALVMSLLATSALIRIWAMLADIHGDRRAVAMTEGEVSVSLAGVLTPLLIAALAATAMGWRFAFVLGALAAVLAGLWIRRVRVPPALADRREGPSRRVGPRERPTLIIVFAIVGLEFSLSFWLASYLNSDIGLSRADAVAAVSGLYASALLGRLAASRLARRAQPELLLAAALGIALVGVPVLLAADDAFVAALGIAIAGIGIGAMFPLTSALHVNTSTLGSDGALGQVLAVAAPGQLVGPLAVGAIAQATTLRDGLLVLPALTLVAVAGLVWSTRARRPGSRHRSSGGSRRTAGARSRPRSPPA
jgi:predicted MFS family arabinose efflux permease